MTRTEILIAFSLKDSPPLGNIWRITAANTDFYLDPLGEVSAYHLAIHAPNRRYPDRHRFHVKVDTNAVGAVRAKGDLILYNLPPEGQEFDGQELAAGVFRVARIRWVWDLQRPRFREAATLPGPVPDIPDGMSGARLTTRLGPNEAVDVDLVVSYNGPYWPGGEQSLRDNSRLGPLRNDAGMWLTATSFRRPQATFPAPDSLIPPLPTAGQEPNRILCGAPGRDEGGEMYWFVEAITSRDVVKANRSRRNRAGRPA